MNQPKRLSGQLALTAVAMLLSLGLGACAAPARDDAGQAAPAPAQTSEAAPAEDAADAGADAEATDAGAEADATSPAQASADVSVEGKKYPYVKDLPFADGPSEGEVTIYFVDGDTVPYVALSEFMPLLSEIFAGSGLEGIEYEVESVNGTDPHLFSVSRDDNKSLLFIDTEKDTLTFLDFNTFTQKPGVSALVSIAGLSDPMQVEGAGLYEALMAAETDEARQEITLEWTKKANEKENGLIQSAAASMNRPGGIKEIKLADYSIDMVNSDGECYIPLQTLCDLFVNHVYVNCVFNGEKLFALQYGSDLVESIYEASPAQMGDDLANYNRNELCLLLDSFYGLKPEHGIEDFDSLITADYALSSGFSSNDAKDFEEALSTLTFQRFDDSHSGFTTSSWRVEQGASDEPPSIPTPGPSSAAKMAAADRLLTARNEAYPEGVPMYEEVGDTAFVTFDAFMNIPDLAEYYSADHKIDPSAFVITGGEEAEPADTVDLIHYAHEQITRESSPIKRVVVDLSNNGGGSSDAAVFVISWLLGRADVALKDTFTGAQTHMSIAADVNFNNLYDSEEDSLDKRGLEIYCLISPGSFSCGNLVPAALSTSGRATLVGQTSGGGSCVVLPCTSASGSFSQISGSKQLAVVKNGSFYNIDGGIEPDVVLTKPESYYNRAALAEYLSTVM